MFCFIGVCSYSPFYFSDVLFSLFFVALRGEGGTFWKRLVFLFLFCFIECKGDNDCCCITCLCELVYINDVYRKTIIGKLKVIGEGSWCLLKN